MTPLRLMYLIVGSGAAAAAGLAWYFLSHQKTPDQRERERRLRINESGRITDGTVIDVSEASPNGHGSIQLLIYQYDVAGVTYECSQDITQLRHYLDLHSCKLGVPASIKYDPQNPGNSIVIAEGWTGLHK